MGRDWRNNPKLKSTCERLPNLDTVNWCQVCSKTATHVVTFPRWTRNIVTQTQFRCEEHARGFCKRKKLPFPGKE